MHTADYSIFDLVNLFVYFSRVIRHLAVRVPNEIDRGIAD